MKAICTNSSSQLSTNSLRNTVWQTPSAFQTLRGEKHELRPHHKRRWINPPLTVCLISRCYGSEVNDSEEVLDVIVLENKKTENFVLLDVKEGLDVVQCKLVLEKLALLHGTSIAMNALKPEMDHSIREALQRRI